jgi:hypothetical protein
VISADAEDHQVAGLPKIPPFKCKELTADEIRQFIELGYVVVREVFTRELAERLIPMVWAELEIDPNDSSTWSSPLVMLKKVLERPPFPEIHTARYLGAVDDLCGEGRWHATTGVGHWPILLPGFANPPWRAPEDGWHVDIKLDQPRIESAELGLLNIELFTDIEPGGGGTAIRVGSHSYVARVLAETKGLTAEAELYLRIVNGTDHLAEVEITGQAGDLLLMHPFTVHVTSPNTSDRARIAAVKLVRLNEPMNLMRRDTAEYSPVELAVINALDENRPSSGG